MGLSHSPSIVSDGLVFYVDPNNIRSYPGFGNTVYNLINSSIGGTLIGYTSALLDNTEARSFYFDGSNDSIPFTNSTSISPTKITVCIWFKKAHGSSFKALIDKGRDNYGAWTLCVDETANKATFKAKIFYLSGVNHSITTSTNYISNGWNFVCGVYDGANLSIYLNGTLSNTLFALHELGNNSYPVTIGAANDGYNVNANIGQAFIYEKALSAADIQQLYNSTRKKYLVEENIVTNGLVLNLDPSNSNSYSGAGNTIYDLSGFGNTGTLSAGLSFSALNGGSIVNDAGNKVLSYPSANFSTNNFTMEAWVSVRNYPSTNAVFISNRGTSDNGWLLDVTSNKKGRVFIQRDAGTSYSIETTNELGLNKWSNLSVVRNGTNLSMYRDGIFQNSTTLPSNYDIQSAYANDYVTRYFGVNGPLDGNVSTIKYYNRALSVTEIQQNYNATKNRFINALPPVRNGLVLELDPTNTASYSGTGNTWYDLSGNRLNGTLLNGASYSGSGTSSSFVFDGVNDRIDFGTVPANTTGRSTIGCWAKTTTTATCMTVTFESYGSIYINRFTTGKILAFFDGSTGNNSSADVSVTSVNDGKWHYLAATNNGTTCSMYIDGVLDKTYSETPSYTTGIYNQIAGQADGFNHMNGSIGFAHIYNRALSAYEIKQNFDFYRTRYGI
jgi:hypothetical protein